MQARDAVAGVASAAHWPSVSRAAGRRGAHVGLEPVPAPLACLEECRVGLMDVCVWPRWAWRSVDLEICVRVAQVGVEICGALKNVLAIAAGIVEGMELGHNAQAALVAQGCSEIR